MKNWFTAYAYWLLTYYAHADVRLLNGGRDVWEGRNVPLTAEVPQFTAQSYEADQPNQSIQADQPDIEEAMRRNIPLIDIRTAEEYRGEILAPPGWNEGIQRGGHIPGAVNIPWSQVADSTGRFKPVDELQAIYADMGIGG